MGLYIVLFLTLIEPFKALISEYKMRYETENIPGPLHLVFIFPNRYISEHSNSPENVKSSQVDTLFFHLKELNYIVLREKTHCSLELPRTS